MSLLLGFMGAKLMKKTSWLFDFLVIMVGLTSTICMADQQNGSLNATPSAKATWVVSCEPEGAIASTRMAFQIEGLTRGRKFTVEATALKDGIVASTVDYKAADKKPSAFAFDVAGDGTYQVTVSKRVPVGPQTPAKLKGTMLYALTAHCESQTGFHTRTIIRRG